MDCTAEALCRAGGDCVTVDGSVRLDPQGAGAGVVAQVDAGETIPLDRLSPPESEVTQLAVASPDGVAVLVTLLPDGRFAMTVQQDIDGPHVETTFGRCRPGA